jgi:hypothetical protein
MSEIPQGAIRFNTDSHKLEFYAQGEWWIMSTDTHNLGRSVDSTPGARGLFGGGYDAPANRDVIDYINISSTGNAIDFGNLAVAVELPLGGSSNTRAVFAGGRNTPADSYNVIQYVTIASTGDTVDFGDRTVGSANNSGGCSNQTRGLFNGGNTYNPFSPVNVIDYVTIASTGDAVDFGDLHEKATQQAATSSPTRGIFAGGYAPGTPHNDKLMEFVTIASTGNAQDFGEFEASQSSRMGACSNATRGLFAGRNTDVSAIDAIIMTSLGNAIDFGNLSTGRRFLTGTSSPIRGVFAGGSGPADYSGSNVIDYVQFAAEGTAIDFGDLSSARGRSKGLSNAHGGL